MSSQTIIDFVQQRYGILSVQMLLTTITAALFISNQTIIDFVQQR
jgi:hypothetical protein